jgi:hypothetical protein
MSWMCASTELKYDQNDWIEEKLPRWTKRRCERAPPREEEEEDEEEDAGAAAAAKLDAAAVDATEDAAPEDECIPSSK